MAAASVSSFAELKTAISDATTTEISVTSDIVFSGGIQVNATKGSVVVDFNGHTVTDNNNLTFTETIYVASTTNTVSVTVKNAIWNGRNYYGVVGVYNGNTNTTIELNNITYTGPQFVYNKNGVTKIVDCNVTLDKNGSTTNPQEFCEANRVFISGNVTVVANSTSDAVIWFTGTGAALTVEEGATFKVTAASTYFLYTDVSPVMLFKNGSDTTIVAKNGLFYASGSSTHIASTFTLEENASFVAHKTVSNSIPMFKCQTSFVLGKNSTFQLYSEVISSTALMYFGQVANIQFNSPKSVVLYNRGGNAFSFQTGSAATPNTIALSAEMLRLWDVAKALESAGGFSDTPTTQYFKANYNGEITMSIKATSSQISSLDTNLAEGDTGYPLAASAFKLLTSKVVSMGNLALNPNAITDISTSVSGTAEKGANMMIEYDAVSQEGTATDSGTFTFPLDSKLAVGTIVKVGTNKKFLTKTLSVTTTGSVSITNLPDLNFFAFTSRSNKSVIFRQDTDWSIEVSDTRADGEDWFLYAHIQSPLTSETSTLDDVLVFTAGGTSTALTNTPLLVYSGTGSNTPKVTNVNWEKIEGILLNINPDTDYTKGEYETSILWQVSPTKL